MRPVNIASKTPSHGENRGSSPLGSARLINDLAPTKILVSSWCPVRNGLDGVFSLRIFEIVYRQSASQFRAFFVRTLF
jgi:hypothetical protein